MKEKNLTEAKKAPAVEEKPLAEAKEATAATEKTVTEVKEAPVVEEKAAEAPAAEEKAVEAPVVEEKAVEAPAKTPSPFDEAGQQMEALVTKEAEECCCRTKKTVCRVIAIGAAVCAVLAAVGCVFWFLKKFRRR